MGRIEFLHFFSKKNYFSTKFFWDRFFDVSHPISDTILLQILWILIPVSQRFLWPIAFHEA